MGERETQTGVGTVISVAHADEGGRLHGHSYEIIAWFDDKGFDALAAQRQLKLVCERIDHAVLPSLLTRAEDIADWVRRNTDAVEVEVNRPLERLYARAR